MVNADRQYARELTRRHGQTDTVTVPSLGAGDRPGVLPRCRAVCPTCARRCEAPTSGKAGPADHAHRHMDATTGLHAGCGYDWFVATLRLRLDNCLHARTRNLYEQRPPSEGRKLVRVQARKCDDCGAILGAVP